MPLPPLSAEHELLRETVRRLVDGPLGAAADQAEGGAAVHAAALAHCEQVGLLELDDVVAEAAAAIELGRLRSGGLTMVLLDAMLTSSLSLSPLRTAVARNADVTITENGAAVDLAFVVGTALADRCLLLDQHVVVELSGATVIPLERPLALRGAAAASVVTDGAPYERVEVPRPALRRAELREAAAAVGAAKTTWDEAVAYAQQREVFGRTVAKFQVNRHALADLATKIAAAQALVLDTAEALSRTSDAETAAARLYAGRVATDVADKALQLHGGYGYTAAFDVERAWRDARAWRAADLTLRARLTAGVAQ